MNNWYALSKQAITATYGQDSDLFTKLLAATSPHSTLAANVTLARKAYELIKQDKLTTRGFLPTHYKLICQALNGGFTTPKVKAFYLALSGDTSQVVVDLWLTRAFYGHDLPTPKQRKHIVTTIKRWASRQGKTPSEMQALLWQHIRGKPESYANLVSQHRLALDWEKDGAK